jgi:hypothetical protein
MKLRTIILSTLSAILAISLIYSVFGSFNVNLVVDRNCGIEAVIPCVEHDVTKSVDVIGSNRIILVSILAGLLAISVVTLLATSFKKRGG